MKYAIILPDGAADEPVRALNGKTPLQAANTPNMDRAAREGQVGTVVTVPDGYSPGSDVATLSLMGYDPVEFHTGRAPLEAVAQGLTATPDQTIFRCNFVTIEDGKMRDFTAGHISQEDAAHIISDLNELRGTTDVIFHAGVSYRNLLIAPHPKKSPSDIEPVGCELTATPPHDIPDQLVVDHLPTGDGSYAVRSMMQAAHDLLAHHPVSIERAKRGEPIATDIWLWGQGQIKPLPTIADRFSLRGAAIAAVDIVRGIAKSAGLTIIEVPGTTGYLDTDYRAKGAAAADALDKFDLVVVHVEAPDEAGHLGDVDAKVLAIEEVDKHVVGPILEKLSTFPESRVLIAPDHPTPVEKRIHTSVPPPFCIAGTGIPPDRATTFDEVAAQTGSVINIGHTLLDRFLQG
jgi:2,3-bisphosphoglycerate-independent phosphoglycerate mutase